MGRKRINGGAKIMHDLKKLGGTAKNGLKVLHEDGRKKGQREGFQQGVNYVFSELSLWERIAGPRNRK